MSTKDSNKTKETIATIDVNISWNAKEQFLDDYLNCPLCGSELLYTHVTHFVNQNVAEEAHCEECKIRTKANTHTLQ